MRVRRCGGAVSLGIKVRPLGAAASQKPFIVIAKTAVTLAGNGAPLFSHSEVGGATQHGCDQSQQLHGN